MRIVQKNRLWLVEPSLGDGAKARQALRHRQALVKQAAILYGDAGIEASVRLIHMPFALTPNFWLDGGIVEKNSARVYLLDELPLSRFFRSANRYKLMYDKFMILYNAAVMHYGFDELKRMCLKDFKSALTNRIVTPIMFSEEKATVVLFRWVVNNM